MDFLSPLLLAGMAAAAAPIVLHLIMRPKPRHLEFPALRFIRRRQVSNSRKLRLRHLILLTLRVAAICLLALALSRPSVTAPGGLVEREAPVAAALVYDTSPRMEYRQGNQSRIEAAQEISRWLLSQLPDESQLAILDSRLDSAVFQIDRGTAQQRVDRLEPTTRGQPLSVMLDEALNLLNTSELPRKEIYVFTDLARGAWLESDTAAMQERLARLAGVGVYVIDVGVESPRNFALGELDLSGQVLAKNSALELRTDITRLGPADGRTVEAYVLDEVGRPVKRDQAAVQLGKNETAPLDFTLSGLAEGTHQGFLRIVGEDGLKSDDTRFFTVEVKPPWPVLVVAPSPAEEYAFYFTEPLAPEHLRKNDQARFRCDVAALEELAGRPLEEYAAVCLLDPTPLPAEAWQKLNEYARAGGGVAVFLGRNAEPVDSFNGEAAQQLLAGRLTMQARHPDGDVHLSPNPQQHPVLAKFRSRAGAIPWDMMPVFRYWRLENLAEGAGIVAPFSDGQPALLERPVGGGRVLTATTPVSDAADDGAWNLLPTGENWPFLVLVNEMMFYLVGSTDGQLNYYAGQTAVLQTAADDDAAGYLLATPTGESIRRTVNRSQSAIVESSTEWIGNYRVLSGGEGGLDRGFSVNLPAEASDLTRLGEEDLKSLFGEIEFQLARGQEEIDRERAFSQVGWELFPYLVVLLALLTGIEHALSNLFYRQK